MKNRINLYQDKFVPRLDFLSLSSVAIGLGLLAALLLVIWAGVAWYSGNQMDALRVVDAQNVRLQADVEKKQATLTSRAPDPLLVKRVADLQRALDNQGRLMAELAAREQIKQTGFSQLLTDLAVQSKRDLWLQHIRVDESNMHLRGQVVKPDAVPQWLQRLAQTQSFSGKTFDTARVYKEEERLQFELSTQRNQADEQP